MEPVVKARRRKNDLFLRPFYPGVNFWSSLIFYSVSSIAERACIERVKLRGIQLSASVSNRKINFHVQIPWRLPVHDTFPSKGSASTIDSIVIWLFNRILLMSFEYSISKDSFTAIPTSQILKFLKLMLYLFIRRKHYAYID